MKGCHLPLPVNGVDGPLLRFLLKIPGGRLISLLTLYSRSYIHVVLECLYFSEYCLSQISTPTKKFQNPFFDTRDFTPLSDISEISHRFLFEEYMVRPQPGGHCSDRPDLIHIFVQRIFGSTSIWWTPFRSSQIWNLGSKRSSTHIYLADDSLYQVPSFQAFSKRPWFPKLDAIKSATADIECASG